MPRHPLTVVDETTGWLDLSLRFLEPWVYPMGPDFTFVKAFDWKLREFEVDEAIRNGDPDALGGLVKVTAPEGVHIIDHVSRDWLWRQPRPLVQHSLPASLKERVRP
jgi:hypothetical protein